MLGYAPCLRSLASFVNCKCLVSKRLHLIRERITQLPASLLSTAVLSSTNGGISSEAVGYQCPYADVALNNDIAPLTDNRQHPMLAVGKSATVPVKLTERRDDPQ
ncbi:hypothetical protein CSKR_203188 [Clonorchis sinensis]|uniref:Uncharacterized protein n=1 Tax=Clonorchis sinensis TaxID=79923 RepID=A0A8T1M800_CLOSI|nr:hypothetical protein CSKR_203188 [Clonorchis sinensis]